MKLTDFLVNIGNPVAYYPKLTNITGGVKETIFLCQLLYWEGKQDNSERWIYKSQDEIKKETGLSRKEQETARYNLKKRDIIVEKYAGLPRKLFFRVNLDVINLEWDNFLACKQETFSHASKRLSRMQARDFLACKQETFSHTGESGKPTDSKDEKLFFLPENTTEITTKNTAENTCAKKNNEKHQEEENKNAAKKNKYAEFVTMTTDEYSSLVAKLSSEERANRCIEILDNYKGANGKKYKSDYRAILNWVIRRLEEEEKERRGPPQKRIPRAFASIQETLERMKDNDNGTS